MIMHKRCLKTGPPSVNFIIPGVHGSSCDPKIEPSKLMLMMSGSNIDAPNKINFIMILHQQYQLVYMRKAMNVCETRKQMCKRFANFS